MNLPLRGIIPPIITPLKSDIELDIAGVEKLIEHVISGGVHGIFLLGTTGEAVNLDYKLRKAFVKKVCSLVNGRVPVVVGITDTIVPMSIQMAQFSKDCGADALVVSAPYYLPMTQNEMVVYLKNLVPKLPLPFIMYNIPSCTKLHLSIDTVKRARDLGAMGIKDSSGDINYLIDLIVAFKNDPHFSVISGTESFIPITIENGGHGAVPGGANLFPKLFVAFYEASLKGETAKIDLIGKKLKLIENNIYNIGKTSAKYIQSIKSALSVMEICDDHVAMPFRKFGKDECKNIEANLKMINLRNFTEDELITQHL